MARRHAASGSLPTPRWTCSAVSWYELAKGYGFITRHGSDAEVFVHSSAILGGGALSDGWRVAFLVVDE